MLFQEFWESIFKNNSNGELQGHRERALYRLTEVFVLSSYKQVCHLDSGNIRPTVLK